MYNTSYKWYLLFGLILCGCGSMPKKPSVEIGVIDYPAGEVITNVTSGDKIKTVEQLSYKAIATPIVTDNPFLSVRVPLERYDKAICFKPDSWELLIDYLHGLERCIKNHTCSVQP